MGTWQTWAATNAPHLHGVALLLLGLLLRLHLRLLLLHHLHALLLHHLDLLHLLGRVLALQVR